jgi:hypothetical protein
MRRTIIVLALSLVCGALSACGKGGSSASSSRAATVTSSQTKASPAPSGPAPSGSAPTTQRALAFARAVNLTSADVPGFTASEKHHSNSPDERRLERDVQRCAGLAGSTKGILEQSSENFQLKRAILDLSVSSEVNVQRSAAVASKGLAAIRSAHVRGCFSRYIQQVFKGQRVKGATIGPVSIQSGNPPAPGTSGGFGWRVTATFDVHSLKVPIYLDFLGFVDGPSEVTLLSSGLLRPFPAAIQQQLFSLLLARAKAHRL